MVFYDTEMSGGGAVNLSPDVCRQLRLDVGKTVYLFFEGPGRLRLYPSAEDLVGDEPRRISDDVFRIRYAHLSRPSKMDADGMVVIPPEMRSGFEGEVRVVCEGDGKIYLWDPDMYLANELIRLNVALELSEVV